MNYAVLAAELTGDPLTRGYSGMTDAEAAADLNTVYRTRQLERLDPADAYDVVDVSEFLALTDAQRDEIWNIVHLGTAAGILVTAGSRARARFIAIFGAGSDTIAALLALITEDISRGGELGLGYVKPGHVTKARAL